MKGKNKKQYILFSKNGEYFFTNLKKAEECQKIHGGYISSSKLYSTQEIVKGTPDKFMVETTIA